MVWQWKVPGSLATAKLTLQASGGQSKLQATDGRDNVGLYLGGGTDEEQGTVNRWWLVVGLEGKPPLRENPNLNPNIIHDQILTSSLRVFLQKHLQSLNLLLILLRSRLLSRRLPGFENHRCEDLRERLCGLLALWGGGDST